MHEADLLFVELFVELVACICVWDDAHDALLFVPHQLLPLSPRLLSMMCIQPSLSQGQAAAHDSDDGSCIYDENTVYLGLISIAPPSTCPKLQARTTLHVPPLGGSSSHLHLLAG